jgi:hypothetical protein
MAAKGSDHLVALIGKSFIYKEVVDHLVLTSDILKWCTQGLMSYWNTSARVTESRAQFLRVYVVFLGKLGTIILRRPRTVANIQVRIRTRLAQCGLFIMRKGNVTSTFTVVHYRIAIPNEMELLRPIGVHT